MWKQKGEEYRVTGYGGWCWVSKTRVQRFVPKLPGNTNVNYRKELEGIFKTFFFFLLTQYHLLLLSCLAHVLHFSADFSAAKMSKANPAATCTNEQEILKTEPQPAQYTTGDGKQMIIDKTPQGESSVEDCKPQTLKEEGKLLEGHMETPEEKIEDEKMENEPCTEATASNAEKGKYHSSIIFP